MNGFLLDRGHGINLLGYHQALVEGCRDRWFCKEMPATCPTCGLRFTGIQVSFLPEDKAEVDMVHAKALVLSGWDGRSGCLAGGILGPLVIDLISQGFGPHSAGCLLYTSPSPRDRG